MLHLAIVFLVIALIAAFLWIRRSGSPLLGRGEDTLRYLPHSRGAVFPGARVRRAILQASNGSATDRQNGSPISFGHTQSQGGVSIVNSETVAQPRSNGSKPIRVLMADPDESLQPVYREPLLRGGL